MVQVGRPYLGHDAAAAQHQHAVAHPGQFVEVRGDHQHRGALLDRGPDDPVDVGPGPDVHALGRLVEQQQRRRCRSQRASTAFCWLPPDSAEIGLAMPGALIPNLVTRSRASLLSCRAAIPYRRQNSGIEASSRLARTDRSPKMASRLRSSGT